MKLHTTIVFLGLVLLSCGYDPVGPPLPPDPFNILGKPGQRKTYTSTVANLVQGTNAPFITPPDSLRSIIHFPESLFSKGIFVYADIQEECTFNRDTLIVQETGWGYNLYSEIFNRMQNNEYDGSYGTELARKYILFGGNIYEVLGDVLQIVYDLPLAVGKTYDPPKFSVIGEEVITTPAGTFNTFKIHVLGRHGLDVSETHYVSTEYGLISSEVKYVFSNETLPWDTSNVQNVIQIQRKELVSIESEF